MIPRCASGFDTWVSSPNFFENSPLLCANGKVVKTDGEGSHVTVDAALDFSLDRLTALKRLQQAGLIAIRQGGASRRRTGRQGGVGWRVYVPDTGVQRGEGRGWALTRMLGARCRPGGRAPGG